MQLNSALIEQSSIIWVLVADGRRAQMYRYHRHNSFMPIDDSQKKSTQQEMNGHKLTPLPDMKFAAEPLSDFHVGHDDRGSKIGGSRPGYNTCEPHLDIHDEIKQKLVKDIATKLKHAYETKGFNHLVIAASPKILGALRLHLDPIVRNSVIAEIDKDFTDDKNEALLAHLQETFFAAHVN